MKKIIEAAKKIATEWRENHREAELNERGSASDYSAKHWRQRGIVADAIAMSWESFVKELTEEESVVEQKPVASTEDDGA